MVLWAEGLRRPAPGGWRDWGGAGRRSRHPYLVVLLEHPLHKLVAQMVELGAAAWGHMQPAGDAGAVQFLGGPARQAPHTSRVLGQGRGGSRTTPSAEHRGRRADWREQHLGQGALCVVRP